MRTDHEVGLQGARTGAGAGAITSAEAGLAPRSSATAAAAAVTETTNTCESSGSLLFAECGTVDP
jgi:hypothetical protein